MKENLTFVTEYLQQMQRRLVAEDASTGGHEWHHSFQQCLSEHIKDLRCMDPDTSVSDIQDALSSLPSDSNSGEMVTMMQQYSDILISMVHKKIAEPKK